MFLNIEQLLNPIEVLWKGMLTIFVGITVIYIIILILSNLSTIKNIYLKRKK